jgi:PAS domain S-box-containing protein
MANNLRTRCPEIVALLGHTDDSIFFKDMDGRFVMVSEAKAKRSNISWDEMLGKTDFDFLPPEEAQRCRDDEIFIMETGQSIIDKEEELTRLNGKDKSWVSVSKFPWKDVDGEIIGVIGISRDISERKLLERHILQMLSIATHDMRGPIVAVASIIKLLARGRFGEISDSVKQTLNDLFDRMSKLNGIVEQYLSRSSLLNSNGIGKKEILDLRQDIIDPILEEFQHEIVKKDIKIDNRLGGIPGDKIMVEANKNWLGIVYRNLFSNAIKHTPENGIIAYGFEDVGEFYRLNVFNTGKSILKERREAIFKMFESGSNSSGIGLSVILDLIHRHGGDLWYQESLDGYPNFVFTLPKK